MRERLEDVIHSPWRSFGLGCVSSWLLNFRWRPSDESSLPSGATATFTSPSVTGSGSSTLDITTAGDVLSGTYPLLITGTSGNLAHTASVTLTITMPNFLLTANPLGQTIRAGNSASYTI